MTRSRPFSLAQWQQLFRAIYGDRNKELTPGAIWLHLMEEAGEVAKDFRRENYRQLEQDLPDVFAWLCGFASSYGLELEEVIWESYPRVCPYCLAKTDCLCIGRTKEKKNVEALGNHRHSEDHPGSLDDWVDMFRDIYGGVNAIQSRAAVGFHLMEEIGEVANEILKDNTARCREELGDVFAWLVGVHIKAQSDQGEQSRTLSEVIWRTFPGHCKLCQRNPCLGRASCPPA